MSKSAPRYNDMIQELQMLLAAMQADDVDVDAALAQYQRGRHLVAALQHYLDTAENVITALPKTKTTGSLAQER